MSQMVRKGLKEQPAQGPLGKKELGLFWILQKASWLE